eukprot:COSAG01_NODE_41922_length_445_cov_4.251445_1_plen_69_part_01
MLGGHSDSPEQIATPPRRKKRTQFPVHVRERLERAYGEMRNPCTKYGPICESLAVDLRVQGEENVDVDK